MDTNTVGIINKAGEKLDGYIAVLAEKAGMATDHFWPVLVRQQIIEGIASGFLAIIAGILSYLLYKKGQSIIFNENDTRVEKNSKSDKYTILNGLALVFGVLFLMFCGRFFFIGLSQILNPEYAALQEVIKMIK